MNSEKEQKLSYFVKLLNQINDDFRANEMIKGKLNKMALFKARHQLDQFIKEFAPYKNETNPDFTGLAKDLTRMDFEYTFLLTNDEEIFKAFGL